METQTIKEEERRRSYNKWGKKGKYDKKITLEWNRNNGKELVKAIEKDENEERSEESIRNGIWEERRKYRKGKGAAKKYRKLNVKEEEKMKEVQGETKLRD